MKLFLLGMMGSGKTYWAEQLSKIFNIPNFDLDNEIEKKERKSIAAIFDVEGEKYFRLKEAEILKSFANNEKYIFSTGGGTPCFYGNMKWMNNNGITVWINESIDTLIQRLLPEKNHRPLIKDLNKQQIKTFLTDKLKERTIFYSQAQYCLQEGNISQKSFADIITKHE